MPPASTAICDELLCAWSHGGLLAARTAFLGSNMGANVCRWCGVSHEQGKATRLPHTRIFIPMHTRRRQRGYQLAL